MANTVTIEVDANTSKAEKDIGGLSGKMKKLAAPVAVASAATTAFAMAAVKLGDEFKEAENTIAAGTGATGEALEALTSDFESVFANVPNDSQEVASAIADLNTELALQGTELQNASTAFLNLSRTMGDDTSAAITGVSDAMAIFNVPASEVESMLDKLTVASQASGVSVTGLAGNLETFGPILKNAGFSIEETTAMFANLEANGISVSRVMPALNGAVRRLAGEGVTDLKGALLGTIEQIKNAETDTEALNLATKTFGADGAQRFSVGIRNGALDLGTMLEAMENSDGALQSLSDSTLTTSDKMDIMKNKVKGALAPLGGIATQIGPLVIMIPAMTTAVSGMSAAMGALNLSMGPVLLGILAVAAAIAAIIIVWKNWDKIVEGAVAVWETLKKAFNSKWAWLLPGGALIKAILMIKDNWDSIWGGMQSVVEGVVSGLKGPINGLIALINGVIEGVNGISVDIPSWVPKLGGKTFGFDIAPIKELAEGGIVKSPTLAMIGEAGPEAVVPLGRNGGMQPVINIYIQGDTYGFDDFEDKVAEAVRDGTRRGGFEGVLGIA